MSSRKKVEKSKPAEEPNEVVKNQTEAAASKSSCLILSQLLMVLFGIVALGLVVAVFLPVFKLQPWSNPGLAIRLAQHQLMRVVDWNEEFGQSALEYAAIGGDIEAVEFLMTKRGAAIDYTRDESALSPFHHIVDQTNEEMLRVVLQKFSQVNTKDMLGYTALHWSSARPWVNGTRLLLAHGADPTVPASHNAVTPMHMAASGGSDEILEMLKQKGAHVDPKTTDGMTPIWMATMSRSPAAVKFFVDHDVDTSLVDPIAGNTLMHVAASSESVEILSMLHKTKGCSQTIAQRNKAGDTPFHIAVRKHALDAASYIAEHGGAAFDGGSHKMGLVELAVTYNAPEVLSFLIGVGADIKTDIAKLLELAQQHETTEIADLLASSSFVGGTGSAKI